MVREISGVWDGEGLFQRFAKHAKLFRPYPGTSGASLHLSPFFPSIWLFIPVLSPKAKKVLSPKKDRSCPQSDLKSIHKVALTCFSPFILR